MAKLTRLAANNGKVVAISQSGNEKLENRANSMFFRFMPGDKIEFPTLKEAYVQDIKITNNDGSVTDAQSIGFPCILVRDNERYEHFVSANSLQATSRKTYVTETESYKMIPDNVKLGFYQKTFNDLAKHLSGKAYTVTGEKSIWVPSEFKMIDGKNKPSEESKEQSVATFAASGNSNISAEETKQLLG